MKRAANQRINQRIVKKTAVKTRTSINILFYKDVYRATITSAFAILLTTIVYIGLYTNVLSLNNKIYTKKMEIAKLEESTQKIINEIEMKTNYRAIEKVALAAGMEYNDNLSYIK